MAPALGFRRRRRRGFAASRSFFLALGLWRRPSSRRRRRLPRQAQAAALDGRNLPQAERSMDMELPEPRRKRARIIIGGGVRSSSGARDLLSDLPDCLLQCIMSLMKTRQVVQTCVLSKRWRHLWRSVPCLDVDMDEFAGGFHEFAVNLMLRCNIALLDSFRLKLDGDWAWAALFGITGEYWTPDRPPNPWRTPSSRPWRLRRLQLTQVSLDDRFLKHVSSVCPSFEDLELDSCSCKIRSITFSSLKNLVLRHCAWHSAWHSLSEITSPTLKTLDIDGGENDSQCLLVIFAPALAYLHLDVDVHCFAGGISIKEMPSLDRASIRLLYHRYFIHNTELHSDRLFRFKFLHSVSNVTGLELSAIGTTVLGKEPTCKEFQNLKSLVLDDCDLRDNRILEFFLQGSPNLEKLTLRHCKLSYDSEVKPRMLNLKTDFLWENLKLEIIYKERFTRQLEFMLRISGNLSENYIKLLLHADIMCTV